MFKRIAFSVAVVLLSTAVAAQKGPETPSTPRIYIFDNGVLTGLDPQLFGFRKEEVRTTDFVGISYLVVHPKGTLMFDTGVIPDSSFKADGVPVTEGISTASRQLKPQLAAAGYQPRDVTYLALSHYHSDHTANANDFAGSTWIVQKAERDAMFGEKAPGITRAADYSALRNVRTKLLDDEDFDVFGDGTVVVKSAPGHTPGHQVLFVRLAKRGPVVLAGDLYHLPEEIATGRTPTFEWNAERSKSSRAKIAAVVKQTGAQLWIEHDKATHAPLPKAPAYVD